MTNRQFVRRLFIALYAWPATLLAALVLFAGPVPWDALLALLGAGVPAFAVLWLLVEVARR